MFLAHFLLPTMLIVICRSQQLPTKIGTDETVNFVGGNSAWQQDLDHSNDLILNRYRDVVAKSLVRLEDACKVHDFLQNVRRNIENVSDFASANSLPGSRNYGQQRFVETIIRLLRKQNVGDSSLYFPIDPNDGTKSTLYYFVSTSTKLQDAEFDEILNDLLYDKCCRDDEIFSGTSVCDELTAHKRNSPRPTKFHAWGGKRSDRNVNSQGSSSSGDDLDKDVKQSKKTPFRPWGGKRFSFE